MSSAIHPLQSQPVKAQPLGPPSGHVRNESFNAPPPQQAPPASQESDWPRPPNAMASGQRPSSNQQHERSFSSASMLNTPGPTASQPPFNNRASMGPGGLLQLQQGNANNRHNGGSIQGPPQLGALSFQEPSQPLDSPSREMPAPQYPPAQGPSVPHQEPSRPVFGVSLNRLYERDGLAVPMVVYQCIQAVDLFGLNVEGIYRLSGSVPHVNKLKTMFDTGE